MGRYEIYHTPENSEMKKLKITVGLFSVGFANTIIFQPNYNQNYVNGYHVGFDKNVEDHCDRTQCLDTESTGVSNVINFQMITNIVYRITGGSHSMGSYQGALSQTKSGRECYPWQELQQQPGASNLQYVEMIPYYERTTYNLLENYCRSIPEHYRQGSYGGMSPIGCFALTRDNNLEWEECSVPTCKQYCSPYPNCDVSQCIDDNDQTGMKYRGDMAKTERGETCYPWKEVIASTHETFDWWGRKTITHLPKYK